MCVSLTSNLAVWKVLCRAFFQRFAVLPNFRIKQKLQCQIRSEQFHKFWNIDSIFNFSISKFLCIVYGPRISCRTPPSTNLPVKPKHNVMIVTLNSTGYWLLAFHQSFPQILWPQFWSCCVIWSINRNTKSLYCYSELQTLIRLLSVHVLQYIWTWRLNGDKTQ